MYSEQPVCQAAYKILDEKLFLASSPPSPNKKWITLTLLCFAPHEQVGPRDKWDFCWGFQPRWFFIRFLLSVESAYLCSSIVSVASCFMYEYRGLYSTIKGT